MSSPRLQRLLETRPHARRNLGLTFAGGGNRAFYQLGLLHQWAERILPRTAAIAACSAGACVVTLFLAERERITRDFWRARRQHVTKNVDFTRLLRGRGIIPHGRIYRDTLLCAYADGGLQRIRAQPFPILIVTAEIPRLMTSTAAALLGFSAYNLEKRVRRNMVHPTLSRRLGFRPHVVDARECETPEELTDLVIASSSSPPFTPVGRFRGRRLLDGGLIDNVPASAAEDVDGVQYNLVMMTRPYPAEVTGQQGKRLYIAPTVVPPVTAWDYTNPDLIDATIAQGEREAELHSPALTALLAR
ncbi:MAG: patatin-like phospholipase family protein [Nannocystaceae bacterium]|nr:patatin-like phospholipase family protein [Nannocystaceae bacterium]